MRQAVQIIFPHPHLRPPNRVNLRLAGALDEAEIGRQFPLARAVEVSLPLGGGEVQSETYGMTPSGQGTVFEALPG